MPLFQDMFRFVVQSMELGTSAIYATILQNMLKGKLIKMKNKKYHAVEAVPRSNAKKSRKR
jgi:hypothetical protein